MCKIMVSYVHVCEILATNSVESPNKDSYVRTCINGIGIIEDVLYSPSLAVALR